MAIKTVLEILEELNQGAAFERYENELYPFVYDTDKYIEVCFELKPGQCDLQKIWTEARGKSVCPAVRIEYLEQAINDVPFDRQRCIAYQIEAVNDELKGEYKPYFNSWIRGMPDYSEPYETSEVMLLSQELCYLENKLILPYHYSHSTKMYTVTEKRLNFINTRTDAPARVYIGEGMPEKTVTIKAGLNLGTRNTLQAVILEPGSSVYFSENENSFELGNKNLYSADGRLISLAENPKDYDREFMSKLVKTFPIYRCEDLLEYHYQRTPDKVLYLKHIRYHILLFPAIAGAKKDFVIDWLNRKETSQNYFVQTEQAAQPKPDNKQKKETANRFNGMPLEQVRQFFQVLTTEINKAGKPFLSPEQLEQFISRAFCGKTEIKLVKINYGRGEKFAIVKLFYLYFNHCTVNYLEPTQQCKPKYVRLLTDNFTGWSFDDISRNFDQSSSKKVWPIT